MTILMKKVVPYSLIFLFLSLSACSQFSTRFESMDDYRPRLIDIVYQNMADTTICEGVPGDTMLAKAYFSGEKVTQVEVAVAFNILKNMYGSDTAFDRNILDYSIDSISQSSQKLTFKYVIPDKIMYTSGTIEEQFMVVSKGKLPDNLSKDEIVMQIEKAIINGELNQLKLEIIPYIMQMVAPIRIFLTANGVHKIQSDMSVRYNRVLGLPDFSPNHNPIIHFIGICKVKNLQGKFDPSKMKSSDTTFSIFTDGLIDSSYIGKNVVSTDTITIDKDFRYFPVVNGGVYNGIDQRDYIVFENKKLIEEFYVLWFCKLGKQVTDSIDTDDKMLINNSGFYSEIIPALNAKVKSSTMWVKVKDELVGDPNRPQGSTCKEFQLNFKYTEAYLKSIE